MKISVSITFEEGVEIRRLVEDFCYGLQEDISPDTEYTVKEDDDVTE